MFNISLTFKKFENKELNVSIDTHIDGKQNTWFKGKDVADALGYKRPRKAISDHVDEEDKIEYQNLKGVLKWDSLKNSQPHTIFINESGLYSLILSSKVESAKKFKHWITSKYYHL